MKVPDPKPPTFVPAYRPARSDKVACARMDRAPQLKLSDADLVVTGEKGYCMCRATHGVYAGQWYYEVEVLDPEKVGDAGSSYPEAHTRLGWAQRYGNLQGPTGVDKFSYSWRDADPRAFHQSRGKDYGEKYGPGDVIGMHISLPNVPVQLQERPKGVLVVYKNSTYYEETQADKVDTSAMKPIPGSSITAYKNGVNQGVMFNDIYSGTYFPSVSMYMGAKVRLNFGPDFKHPPTDAEYKPMSEMIEEHNSQLCVSDVIGKVVNGLKEMEELEKKIAAEKAAAEKRAAEAIAEAKRAEKEAKEAKAAAEAAEAAAAAKAAEAEKRAAEAAKLPKQEPMAESASDAASRASKLAAMYAPRIAPAAAAAAAQAAAPPAAAKAPTPTPAHATATATAAAPATATAAAPATAAAAASAPSTSPAIVPVQAAVTADPPSESNSASTAEAPTAEAPTADAPTAEATRVPKVEDEGRPAPAPVDVEAAVAMEE